MSLQLDSIRSFIATAVSDDEKIRDAHTQLLTTSPFTRDEEALSHFCVYFVAVDITKHLVFLGHHKKANLWLANGGHIDVGETIEDTLFREISEEWGVPIEKNHVLSKTRMSITDIENERQPRCKQHLDLWYVIDVDSTTFHPIEEKLATEFHETRWVNIQEALDLVEDPNTIATLHWIDTDIFNQ